MIKLANSRVGGLLFLSLYLLTVFMPIFPQKIKAASVSTIASDWGVTVTNDKKNIVWSSSLIKAKWIDATTIQITSTKNPSLTLLAKPENDSGGNTELYDQRGSGNQSDYFLEGWHNNPCYGMVSWDKPDNPWEQVKEVSLDMDFQPDSINSCIGGKDSNNKIKITVENPENSVVYYKWLDPTQLQTINNKYMKNGSGSGIFKQAQEYPDVFVSQDEPAGSCQSRVVVASDKKSLKFYALGDSFALEATPKQKSTTPAEAHTTCGYYNGTWLPSNVSLGINNQIALTTVPPGQGAGGDSTQNSSSTCEDKFQTFGVIVCFILDGIDKLLGFIEGTVSDLLEVDTATFSTTGQNGEALYQAWLGVVRVSSGVLAIIAIIMVLGTALGGYRLFDSYTVKKVLPRLVIAAIAMWLSWALVTTYINAMNTIGRGIADLMWEPFASTSGKAFEQWGLANAFGTAQAGTGGGTETLFNMGVIGGLVVAGSSLAAGGAWTLLSALFPVLLFMLIGFIVLVLREAIIVFLLVTAPFAIVTWVLPNTQTVWNKWSKFLNQLLFMYPMFMGILAAGKIFSYISSQGSTDSTLQRGLMSLFVPVVAYIAPYALLPSIFKTAGGALSKVTGTVTKLGGKATGGAQKTVQGFADARKKVRAEDRVVRGRIAQGSGYKIPFTNTRLSSTARFAQAAERARTGQAIIPITSKSESAAALQRSRTAQTNVVSAQKEIEEILGGDLDARKAIASGETFSQVMQRDSALAERMQSTGAARFLGDRYAQAGATMGLSAIGKVKEENIATMASNFRDDQQTSAALVSQASRAAKGSGQTAIGALRYDYESGGVGYEGMVTDPSTGQIKKGIATDRSNPEYIQARNSSVANALSSMSTADLAGLGVEGDGSGFKDTSVSEALRANPALASRILNDENVKLSATQRQALKDVGAVENTSSGGNSATGGGLNIPPNSSTGGGSFS